ncbi:hypothetical protein [Acidihalobacter prosperus]|uniref:Uncharacterized protein n=1 Tax=Acidihalobacter prosperus TaxID=160660 RepID=A0A1A6C6C5_9GAMM|nr:hypothetical protein [Acidihalobacter prosperus]OBS10114.1 hypothetical protein Thpro_021164 [Acidihalobacter prosperus]
MKFSRKQRTFAGLAGALTVAAALCFGATAQAADTTTAKPGAEANDKVMQMEQRFMQLRAELAQTQQEAVKKSPELAKQEKHFRELLVATMKRQGTDPQPKIDELNKLGRQIQDKNTDNTTRQTLITKARAIQAGLIQAENKAVSDPKVAAARKKLSEETVAAMSKVNPKTKAMIAELNAIGKRLAEMHGGQGG